MKMIIKSYADPGKLSDERIGFNIESDCDLKFYAVHQTNSQGSGFNNRIKRSYWFAPKKVKAGDKVILYTKSGVDSEKNNLDGTTSYFFYWGLKEAVLNAPKDGIVLAEMTYWQTKFI